MHLYGKNVENLKEPLGQCCSNFIWNLLGAGKWRIAKMVAVHWPKWPPNMVKTFKNLLLHNQRMPCGWIFAYIIGDGRSTKIAKIMVVHWHLTVFRRGQVCFPMHVYGKMLRISNDFSGDPGPVPLKFYLEPAWWMKDCHWPRWPPCPYMVKTFKNLLLHNRGCLVSWNFAQIIRDGMSTKVAKMMVVHWLLIFYSEVNFASVCICMGPIHLYGKNVDNFKWLFLWSLWANVAQISCRAFLGQEN